MRRSCHPRTGIERWARQCCVKITTCFDEKSMAGNSCRPLFRYTYLECLAPKKNSETQRKKYSAANLLRTKQHNTGRVLHNNDDVHTADRCVTRAFACDQRLQCISGIVKLTAVARLSNGLVPGSIDRYGRDAWLGSSPRSRLCAERCRDGSLIRALRMPIVVAAGAVCEV